MTKLESSCPAPIARARSLLGTLVTVHVVATPGIDTLGAIDAAFEVMANIHDRMSAHSQDSDLAHLAHASAGERVPVHPHTASVLRLARHWRAVSGGAFDPQAAAQALAQRGCRPGIAKAAQALGTLAGSEIGTESVLVDGPLALDLGGIAKGFAVDQAVGVLRSLGVAHGLVNAGGDLRAFGDRSWPVEVRHPVAWTRTRRLLRLREGAVASSAASVDTDFVQTRRRHHPWNRCTVLARDCATADALTKWALQAPVHSVQWRAALGRAGAKVWRD